MYISMNINLQYTINQLTATPTRAFRRDQSAASASAMTSFLNSEAS